MTFDGVRAQIECAGYQLVALTFSRPSPLLRIRAHSAAVGGHCRDPKCHACHKGWPSSAHLCSIAMPSAGAGLAPLGFGQFRRAHSPVGIRYILPDFLLVADIRSDHRCDGFPCARGRLSHIELCQCEPGANCCVEREDIPLASWLVHLPQEGQCFVASPLGQCKLGIKGFKVKLEIARRRTGCSFQHGQSFSHGIRVACRGRHPDDGRKEKPRAACPQARARLPHARHDRLAHSPRIALRSSRTRIHLRFVDQQGCTQAIRLDPAIGFLRRSLERRLGGSDVALPQQCAISIQANGGRRPRRMLFTFAPASSVAASVERDCNGIANAGPAEDHVDSTRGMQRYQRCGSGASASKQIRRICAQMPDPDPSAGP